MDHRYKYREEIRAIDKSKPNDGKRGKGLGGVGGAGGYRMRRGGKDG